MLLCQRCRKEAFNQCSKCHQVAYCSKECQKEDWKKHKKDCHLSQKSPHHFTWSPKWEISLPGFSDDGLSVSCFGKESLVTSEKKFTSLYDECNLKVFTHSTKMKVGICTKDKKGKTKQRWLYSSVGAISGPKVPEKVYGKSYTKGDVVTVKLTSSLSFSLNNEDLGVAFDGLNKERNSYFLCVLLNNAFNLDPENIDASIAENRPSAVQLLAL